MKDTRVAVAESYVSYLDLFVGGLTNLCSDIFCDISVLGNLIDIRSKESMFHIEEEDHLFLWEFIKLLTKENLAVVNFEVCLYDWEERMMDPRILAPLTYRGIELRDYIEQKHPETVCESPVSIVTDYYWDKRMEKLTI